MNDTENHITALLVSKRETPGADASHIELHPVKLYDDGKIRNFSDHSWPRENPPLSDFRISCQLDNSSETPYGFRAEYREVFSVDLERAEEIVKLMRKIKRESEKLSAEWGPAETFTAYVIRVAKIIGAKKFGWATSNNPGWSYDESSYHFTDADGLVYKINSLLAEHAKKVNA